MWAKVQWFEQNNIPVQQFYGKWPFVRLFGLQEPASVLFSILNLFSHVIMIYKFRSKVTASCPLYKTTHIYCLICCNGWFWSAVFHARDLHYTEIMDYLSALSMVLFSVYHMLIRMQGGDPTEPASLCLALAMTSFFFYHSYTSFFVGIYYGYNMFVNLFFGGYLA